MVMYHNTSFHYLISMRTTATQYAVILVNVHHILLDGLTVWFSTSYPVKYSTTVIKTHEWNQQKSGVCACDSLFYVCPLYIFVFHASRHNGAPIVL